MSLPTLPTPVIYVPFFKEVRTVHQGDYYTAEQMQAYGQVCRAAGLEEAAQICESENQGWHCNAAAVAATKIRSLR